MAVEYTDQQRAAIESRGRELIVSAAAGSGKTAVLVDRVVGLLCDRERPVDIDRLLVVTFTNAAAAEMRGRIADALASRLAENPADFRLRRQLALLGESRIQTVHAFCQDLLRRNFAQAGVSPDFTLADKAESDRLKARAMEALLEEAYAAASPGFGALRENLCEERGDSRLQQAVLLVYEKLRSHPDPARWLAYTAAQNFVRPEQSGWGRSILAQAGGLLAYARGQLDRAAAELESVPAVAEKYRPAFARCQAFGQALAPALETGWDAAVQALEGFEKPALASAPRGSDKAFTTRMQAARDAFCEDIARLRGLGLARPADQVMAQEARARPIMAELCRLVARFTQLYDGLKAADDLLDFSDLEHGALGLLRRPDGGKTELALSLDFAEVLVDEYQDTNEVQEQIFLGLTRPEGSAFFVGDVKQSIYRFRLANPDIFLDRLHASRPLEAGGEGRRAGLSLSRNFRSLPPVIDLCNHIFTRIMSRQLGEVDYDATHRLAAGLEGPGEPCELWLLETDGLRQDEEDSEEKAAVEARLAADRVAHILREARVQTPEGSRPARPGDCAILLSSYSSRAPYYSQALLAAGIPAQSPEGGDFFGAVEISILISLLRILDNRRQDIPLIAVLRSPLFLFDADDLAAVRLHAPGADFCGALETAAAAGHVKSGEALGRLDPMARAAAYLPVAQLIRLIYRETAAQGVFAALPGGQGRLRNLETLYQMALTFEAGGARGLHAFIGWLDGKLAQGQAPAATQKGEGVQIMSIHKSKGLEFPFVILPDLSKRFNTDDTRGPVLFHQNLGLGLTLREPALRVEYKTAAHTAIAAHIRREGLSEEMRKLYVAMTRARQRLVLILSLQKIPQKLADWAPDAQNPVPPEFLARQQGAAPWLCAALLRHPDAGALRAVLPHPPAADEEGGGGLVCRIIPWQAVPQPAFSPAPPEGEALPAPDYTAPLARMEQAYAWEAASRLPSKLTPTGVKRLVPDAGEIDGEPGRASVRFYRAAGDAGLSALGRGSALHAYLRHMDYTACGDSRAAAADILRVAMAGFLTAREAAAIDPADVAALAASPLGDRVRAARRVLREYEFSALFTPHQLLGNGMEDEQILLNGAIDLLLFIDGGLEVVDFKSDAVAPGFEARQAERHRLQLDLYARAAESIFGLPALARTVYFTKTGGQAML